MAFGYVLRHEQEKRTNDEEWGACEEFDGLKLKKKKTFDTRIRIAEFTMVIFRNRF